MDDETILEEETEQRFTELLQEVVADGVPVKLATACFITASMMAFRHYLASDDPARIPALLRRFAGTVEARIAGRK